MPPVQGLLLLFLSLDISDANGKIKIMESEKKVFSINNLNIKFTLRGRVLHAIRDVSLDIYKGESLAVVGESGSG